MRSSSSRSRPARSEALLNTLTPYREVLVVTHDNPDPDAVAAGWAIYELVRRKLGKPVRLVASGAIVRAENQHMLKLLKPPIELVDHVQTDAGTAAVLVDCSPEASNHLLADLSVSLLAVIDHHEAPTSRRVHPPFEDIRVDVAASATIAASYLQEQQLEPGSHLATALLYALGTETRAFETEHSPLDHAVLSWLVDRANPTWVAEIENAPLPREYFSDFLLALEVTVLCEDAALCLLPRANGSEIVGEVADLLIRCEGIRRVLCGANVAGDLLISVRTERGGENATALLLRTIEGWGQGGGHEHRAGGKIAHINGGPRIASQIAGKLRERWFNACRVQDRRETRLVAQSEIAENL